MRICLLCYRANPYSGGQGIYLKYIAEELIRQGHEVHVIAGPPYPSLDEKITVHRIHNNEYFIKKGLSIIDYKDPMAVFQPVNFYEYFSSRFGVFPEIKSFSIRAYLKIRSLSQNIKFDIIHDNQCLGYGLMMMKSLGIPLVATIHHPLTIDLKNAVLKASSFKNAGKVVMFYPVLMQRLVSRQLDHIITVSEDSKNMNHSHFGIPLEKQTVIYNGTDTDIFRPVYNIKKNKKKLIFVGNVTDEKKGFTYLARAMRSIDSSCYLTVVDGGSPHRKGIDDLLNTLGISHRVEFTGKITTDELVRHYNEAQIAIVPSVYEGFGFPASEAMACGTPVIASDGGALPEVVGDAGITVPARDVSALAEAVNMMLSNKKKLKQMREKGISRVENMFSWEKTVSRIVEVYSRFIN